MRKEDNKWVKKYMEYEVGIPEQVVDQRPWREGCAKRL